MSLLIEFISANNWNEKVFIDPNDVSSLEPHHIGRDLSTYTKINLRDGTSHIVPGVVTAIAATINEARHE